MIVFRRYDQDRVSIADAALQLHYLGCRIFFLILFSSS